MSLLSPTVGWAVLVLVLFAIEMMSGTFYLLALACAAGCACLGAWFGCSVFSQCLIFAAASVVSCLLVVFLRRRMPQEDRIQNLDVGQTVRVESWSDDATASVRYRGADWVVFCENDAERLPGTFRIVEVVGSRLKVQKCD